MKKQFTFLTLTILFAAGKISAQTFSPVPTTGYSLDAIAENTTALQTTGGAIDGSNYVLYSNAFGQIYSTGTGIPNNGLITSGSKTYQLQSYTDVNVLYVQGLQTDSLIFTNPQPYPAVSLLGFATEGQGSFDLTVRFTDNTTQVFSGLTLDDWFTPSATPILSGFDRVNRLTDNPDYNTTDPNMYSIDLNILCANQNKSVQTIAVHNTNTNSRVCILAASAVLPTYAATASTLAICSGGTVSINATGFSTYTWQPVGSFAGSNTASIVVSPTTTTSYTLDGIVAATTCPGRTVVTINSSTGSPTVSFAGSTPTVCLGAAATITASGAFSYTLSNGVANGASFVPAATADYTVIAENGCGTSTAVTTITVSPLQISVSTSTNLVCSGGSVSLTGGGGTTYSWVPGPATSSNYIASPGANTIYTVTGQTGNCIGTNTIAINTMPLPSISITPDHTLMCSGDAVSLTASGNAVTYTWSPGGQNGATINDTPSQVSVYNVSGTGSNGCIGYASQIILVYPNPTVNAIASSPVICPGSTAVVTASGAHTYSWSTSDLTASVVVNPSSDVTYTVTGTSTTGCSTTTFVSISVLQPTVGITSDVSALCLGAHANITASGADTYSWSNGSNLQSINVSPTQNSVFTVTASVTDANTGLSCDASTTIQITVNPNPTITASASRSIICQGESAVLTANGAGTSGTYTWTGGPTAVSNASVTVSPIATQNYTATGTDVNGCKNKVVYSLTVKICTGIASISADKTDLVIYPNPSNGEFTIAADEAIDLMIINDLGQPVRAVKLNGHNDNKVVVSDLAAGIYFIQSVNSDQPVVKQKIMIVK